GTPTLVRDVVNMVNDALGNPITINFGAQPYRENDSMEFYLDIKKAKRLLEWEPRTSLKEGIAKTAQWYREKRSIT
ncbi:MAG TPA: NAD(P)-dependent oxidoreductase, partial [Candidatus Paceibacterota bacterium]